MSQHAKHFWQLYTIEILMNSLLYSLFTPYNSRGMNFLIDSLVDQIELVITKNFEFENRDILVLKPPLDFSDFQDYDPTNEMNNILIEQSTKNRQLQIDTLKQ